MNKIKVVYAVYGETAHFLDARVSIASLRKVHPDALVDCFTTPECVHNFADMDVNVKVISDINLRKTSWHDPNFKVNAIYRSTHSSFIFLDNDTYLSGSLQDAWSMLQRNDLMGVLAPNSDSRAVLGYNPLSKNLQIPDAFSEINSGVLFFNNTEKTLSVVRRWKELLNIRPEELGDQWRLRIALYENEPKLCILPNTYNYRLAARQPVFGSVRVIHGRHDNMGQIAEALNKKDGYRFPFNLAY